MINVADVLDGALIDAMAATGRRITTALTKPHGRKADDLEIARWFETYRWTARVPDLPGLSPATMARITGILRGDEIQAALQELLAARLTDAPETDAARAREAIQLTLNVTEPDTEMFVDKVVDYYDDRICALVARLESRDSQLLSTIRSEAFSTRIIAILNAIERHIAALGGRHSQRTETDFLTRYRRHVIDQHGKIEPPDFDRRRRVPIQDIYVPTNITEDRSNEQAMASGMLSSLNVYDLARRLDRTVLLGDPGAGKTTAANVLMHRFASDGTRTVPFLVTLRDYASKDPPARSMTGHIEHTLETFYQCPAPVGLVDLLLLTGRATVLFDGLDELLDTSRRSDVATRVERFCAEYPLARILVTSRVVGYQEARLDDSQFTCYRLGGFNAKQVADYARCWFAQDAEARSGDAEALIAESASVPDLRSNPLMLALLCILYRGEGSLPRNRAEVYEQCATLLYRKWDTRRRIHYDLRAGHLLEPILRHLAWWLFTGDNAQSAVTERSLIVSTTKFLHRRGFESEDDAQEAAREFVEFCRGRMWVFSDAGTTAAGEKLYAFTHRTFLEYFAAAQLAYDQDTPEELANSLAPYVARNEWRVAAELAIQLKDQTSNEGAQRIYASMLNGLSGQSAEARENLLSFLAQCMQSVDPGPRRVRQLTRQLFEESCKTRRARYSGAPLTDRANPNALHADKGALASVWRDLLTGRESYRNTIADEIDTVVAINIHSGNQRLITDSLRLVFSLPEVIAFAPQGQVKADWGFWSSRAYSVLRTHNTAAITGAKTDAYLRLSCIQTGLITTKQALSMPGGPIILFQEPESCFEHHLSYFWPVLNSLDKGWPTFANPSIASDLAAFGQYLIDHPEPPWLRGRIAQRNYSMADKDEAAGALTAKEPELSQRAYLGAVAILSILVEVNQLPRSGKRNLGPLDAITSYLNRRKGSTQINELGELRVPRIFKEIFLDWAEGRVHFSIPQ